MRCYKDFRQHSRILSRFICGMIFLLIFFNCKDTSGNSQDQDAITRDKDSINTSVNADTTKSEGVKPGCKYDMSEQTDDFLSGIEELNGYEWDDKEKSAALVLNDHWGLTLRRGGCDYFELSATFYYDRNLNLEESKNMVFDQVKWITGLLNEFNSELIEKALDSGYVAIQQVSEGDYFINFLDERLSDDYFFRFQTWEDATNFKIGQYIE
ncbi:MAG: hypothetical protein KJN68_12105 [Bacteroidia bacterium]|nr:hypothetical protein [Bacteroidia bacterium]